MMNASLLALICAMSAVIPPLSPEQKAKVESVKDQVAEVDPGFYALMENAATWPVNDEPAGLNLNAAAVLATPAEFRGLPMVIEGDYIGLHEVHMVKESGPWDGKLEQWGVRVAAAEMPVMVFLVNPPPVPVQGQKVRLTGRFYKVWPVTDDRGRKLEYLVFIGLGARVQAGLTLPALSEAERKQLAVAVDFTDEIDRGPLYPLLNNAVLWKDRPLPAAPLITHGDPIIGAPGEYRGLPLRAEGTLVRRQEFKSTRGGAWQQLEQWVIEITPKTKDKPGESVIFYLVDPPAELKVGDKVRVVGRFYKVWRTYQAKGEVNEPFNFVVLVGSTAEPIDRLTVTAVSGTGGGGASVSSQIVRMALGAALVLGFGFYLIRRYARRIGMPGGGVSGGLQAILEKRRLEREAAAKDRAAGNGDDAEPDIPLPSDPAEALLEMERRRVGEP
jgi:hypothetical protein